MQCALSSLMAQISLDTCENATTYTHMKQIMLASIFLLAHFMREFFPNLSGKFPTFFCEPETHV